MTRRTQKRNGETTMTYDKACKILGYTTPKSLEANAELARTCLKVLAAGAPLKYSVACQVLINAAR
jgi:hypothetical protein